MRRWARVSVATVTGLLALTSLAGRSNAQTAPTDSHMAPTSPQTAPTNAQAAPTNAQVAPANPPAASATPLGVSQPSTAAQPRSPCTLRGWLRCDDVGQYGMITGVGLAGLAGYLVPPTRTALIGPAFDADRPSAILASRYSDAIGKPYKQHETVPLSTLAAAAGVSTALLWLETGLYASLSGSSPPAEWGIRLHDTLLGSVESLVFTFATTETLKDAFGRLRPDFQDRVRRYYCGQAGTATLDCAGLDKSTAITESELEDGRKSFPSGHASLSFAVATYGFLVLGGQFEWGDTARWGTTTVAALAAQTALLGTATWISASRVADGRHNESDVLVGAAIGAIWANVAYWRRFDLRGRPRRLVSGAGHTARLQSSVDIFPTPGGLGLAGQF